VKYCSSDAVLLVVDDQRHPVCLHESIMWAVERQKETVLPESNVLQAKLHGAGPPFL
jgi:hypothetical protein